MAVSPNNVAFVLNLTLPVTSFILVSYSFDRGDVGRRLKVLVSHHTILLDTLNPITLEFQRLMNHKMFLSNKMNESEIHKTYYLRQYYSSYALMMIDLGE